MTDCVQDRLKVVMLRLKRYELDSSDPKWSSYSLDRFIEEVLTAPGSSIWDLYQGLDAILKTHAVELTETVAAFIRDLVVRCFTRFRRSYESVNWKDVGDSLTDRATAAQLYLALHAIPPQFVTPRLADVITRGLDSTAFRNEAVGLLAV